MLQIRVIDGLEISRLEQGADPSRLSQSLDWLQEQGLIEAEARAAGRVRLTLEGRLLGDAVTRELLPDPEGTA